MGVHQELADQVAPYVLGALTRADTVAFEAHLSICAECMAEVHGFAPVVEGLASLTPHVTPEAKVRRAVLAWMRADG